MSGTEAQNNLKNRGKSRLLWVCIAGIVLIAALCTILLAARGTKPTAAEPKKAPDYLLYMKGKAVYHTLIDEINPRQVIEKYDYTGRPLVFVSGDGQWLFYPRGEWENADLYRCSLNAPEQEHQKLAAKAAMFTSNYDGTRLVYLADKVLYTAVGTKTEEIARPVERYFTNPACDTILYLTTDQMLYLKKGSQKARKLDENVWFRYISPDLNTIYYARNDSTFLVKNGGDPIKIKNIVPYSMVISDGEDVYLSQSSEGPTTLFHYADGVCTEVVSQFRYYLSNLDYTFYYPYRTMVAKADPPIIMVADAKEDAFILKGAQVLKRISGAFFRSVSISPDGRDLYYLADDEQYSEKCDLFHVTIDGTTVSESRRIDTNVSLGSNIFFGNHFVYFKNSAGYPGIGDMYADGEMIAEGVLEWGIEVVGDLGAFLYPVNSKDYSNEYNRYTSDTLMLYRDGSSVKIADHVIEWMVYGEKIAYLQIENLDAPDGTLHLYDSVSGKDVILDTNVVGIVRPKADRERDAEINLQYRIGDHYP